MKAKREPGGQCMRWFPTIGATLVFTCLLLSLIGSLWFAPFRIYPMMSDSQTEYLKPFLVLPGLLILVCSLALIAKRKLSLLLLGQMVTACLSGLLLSPMTRAKQYTTFSPKLISVMGGLTWTLRSRLSGLAIRNLQPMPRYCFHE